MRPGSSPEFQTPLGCQVELKDEISSTLRFYPHTNWHLDVCGCMQLVWFRIYATLKRLATTVQYTFYVKTTKRWVAGGFMFCFRHCLNKGMIPAESKTCLTAKLINLACFQKSQHTHLYTPNKCQCCAIFIGKSWENEGHMMMNLWIFDELCMVFPGFPLVFPGFPLVFPYVSAANPPAHQVVVDLRGQCGDLLEVEPAHVLRRWIHNWLVVEPYPSEKYMVHNG